jgi:hypothetical protein
MVEGAPVEELRTATLRWRLLQAPYMAVSNILMLIIST